MLFSFKKKCNLFCIFFLRIFFIRILKCLFICFRCIAFMCLLGLHGICTIRLLMGICIGANGLKGQLRQHQLTLAAKAPFDFSLAILFFFLEVLYVSLFLWDLSYIFCLLPYLLHIFLLLFLWQILLNNECWMQRSTVVYIIINITGLCGYVSLLFKGSLVCVFKKISCCWVTIF